MENFSDNKENYRLFLNDRDENKELLSRAIKLIQKLRSKDTLRTLHKINHPTLEKGNFLKGMKFKYENKRDKEELEKIITILRKRYKAWCDVKRYSIK